MEKLNPHQFIEERRRKFIEGEFEKHLNAEFPSYSPILPSNQAEIQAQARRKDLAWQEFKDQGTWPIDPYTAMIPSQWQQYPFAKMQRGGFKNSFNRFKSDIFGRTQYPEFSQEQWNELTKDIPESEHWRFLYALDYMDGVGIRDVLERELLDHYILQHATGATGLASDLIAGVADPLAWPLIAAQPLRISGGVLAKTLGMRAIPGSIGTITKHGVRASDAGAAMLAYHYLDTLPSPTHYDTREWVHSYIAGVALYAGFEGASKGGKYFYDQIQERRGVIPPETIAPEPTAVTPETIAPEPTAVTPEPIAPEPTATVPTVNLTPEQQYRFDNISQFYRDINAYIDSKEPSVKEKLINDYDIDRLKYFAKYLGISISKGKTKEDIVNSIEKKLSNTPIRYPDDDLAMLVESYERKVTDEITALKGVRDNTEKTLESYNKKDLKEIAKLLKIRTNENDTVAILKRKIKDKVKKPNSVTKIIEDLENSIQWKATPTVEPTQVETTQATPTQVEQAQATPTRVEPVNPADRLSEIYKNIDDLTSKDDIKVTLKQYDQPELLILANDLGIEVKKRTSKDKLIDIIAQQVADSEPTVAQQVADSEPTVAQQVADSEPTVAQQVAEPESAVAQQVAEPESAVAQQVAEPESAVTQVAEPESAVTQVAEPESAVTQVAEPELTPEQTLSYINFKQFFGLLKNYLDDNVPSETKQELLQKVIKNTTIYKKDKLLEYANYLGIAVNKSGKKEDIFLTITNVLKDNPVKYNLDSDGLLKKVTEFGQHKAFVDKVTEVLNLPGNLIAAEVNTLYVKLSAKDANVGAIEKYLAEKKVDELKDLAEFIDFKIPSAATNQMQRAIAIIAEAQKPEVKRKAQQKLTDLKNAAKDPDALKRWQEKQQAKLVQAAEILAKENEKKLHKIQQAIEEHKAGHYAVGQESTGVTNIGDIGDGNVIAVSGNQDNAIAIELTAEQLSVINQQIKDETKNTHQIHIGNNEYINVKAMMSDLDSLVESHLVSGHENKLYREIVDALGINIQPRNREREASKLQMNQIKNTLNPERLYLDNEIGSGSPITFEVKHKGKTYYLVIHGNGRTAGIRGAAKESSELYQGYKNFFQKLHRNKFKNPIFHRVIEPEHRANLEDIAQRRISTGEAGFSPSELAKLDAKKLTPDDLDLLKINFHQAKTIEAIFGENKPFIQIFMRKNITTSESAAYLHNDQPSLILIGRMHAALIQKAYDNDAFSHSIESTSHDLSRVHKELSLGALAIAKARKSMEELNLKTSDNKGIHELIMEAHQRVIQNYRQNNGMDIDVTINQQALIKSNDDLSSAQTGYSQESNMITMVLAYNYNRSGKIQLFLQMLSGSIIRDADSIRNSLTDTSNIKNKTIYDYILETTNTMNSFKAGTASNAKKAQQQALFKAFQSKGDKKLEEQAKVQQDKATKPKKDEPC
jgi:hypothetical protein